jgi:hypothetical protein
MSHKERATRKKKERFVRIRAPDRAPQQHRVLPYAGTAGRPFRALRKAPNSTPFFKFSILNFQCAALPDKAGHS